MSRKTHVKRDADNVETRFVSKVKQLVDFIAPKDLYLVSGRGSAKTTDIIAERSQLIINDMPGSYQMFLSDTYVNALTNVLPALIEGWMRKSWHEGIHFVTDKRPPSHFKLPYKPPLHYKHTISLYNGTIFTLGSLDQPSGLAGASYQHRYGDEARLLKKKKLDRSTPALRGEFVRFGHSVFYMGNTFTTDMPNILTSDDDWILGMEKEMDQEQIELALQAAMVLNEIKLEMMANEQIGKFSERARLEKSYRHWNELWIRIRKDSTFFYAISSLVNLDILTEGYFTATLKALGPEEFKSAILSFRISVSKGEKFYGFLDEHHFYDDGSKKDFYDKFEIQDTIVDSSEALRYIDHNGPLECGVDFGDMCSLVSGQLRGSYLYALKEFWTLAPENEDNLGQQFRDFYINHKNKNLFMYYDRSGNQNAKVKRDRVSYLKKAIEYLPNGTSSGWTVELMSLNQSTIYHEEEFNFAKKFMAETVKGLPKLRIDQFKCKCLKSSLELTKILVKIDNKGSKSIHKDKSTEKLPLASRPMFSTNFADAFKYWIYRREFVDRVNTDSLSTYSDPFIF